MLTKRIIPCLDVKGGQVVKGTSFVELRDAGDPVELARFYYEEGADELTFLDITATPDKVSINTAAVLNSVLIKEGADKFGSQCIVVAIDAKRVASGDQPQWEVYIYSGQKPTGIDALAWARQAVEFGAGEILLTSMDADGHRAGYDIELTRAVSEAVSVPVIASGGAGTLEDLYQALVSGKADAVLAASIFHYGIYTIRETKEYLAKRGIPIRI